MYIGTGAHVILDISHFALDRVANINPGFTSLAYVDAYINPSTLFTSVVRDGARINLVFT